jgi:hypothetical protein
MSKSTTFTAAGIGTVAGKTKVYFGNDLVARIKILNKKLNPTRLDMIELGGALSKIDAIKFLKAHADFQSPADQATLDETLATKEKTAAPKTPRVTKAKTEKSVKVAKSSKKDISIEGLLARSKAASEGRSTELNTAGVVANMAPLFNSTSTEA